MSFYLEYRMAEAMNAVKKGVQAGLRKGIENIPRALMSKVKSTPVKEYAMNPMFSANRSAQKRFQNINSRFRREAASEVKKSLASLFNEPETSPGPKLAKATPLTRSIRSTPRVNLYSPPLSMSKGPRNEMRGGTRKKSKRN